MFDFGIGSFELMMLAIVAIIVVGPKDLPKMLRTVGKFTTKVRSMAREFQGYLDEAARETGLDDVKKEVGKMTDFSVNDLQDTSNDIKSAMADAAPEPVKVGDNPAKTETKPAVEKSPAKKSAAKKPAAKKTVGTKVKPAKKTAKV